MRSETLEGHEGASALSDLLEQVVGDAMAGRASAVQRARTAWFGANGDRERAHTTRVFLREGRAGAAPILCVYVDSHAYVTDLTANRDLYLSRLANWGFYVSGIEFSVDREHVRAVRAARSGEQAQQAASQEPVELPDDLAARVEQLPEPLRDKVSKAIFASLRKRG